MLHFLSLICLRSVGLTETQGNLIFYFGLYFFKTHQNIERKMLQCQNHSAICLFCLPTSVFIYAKLPVEHFSLTHHKFDGWDGTTRRPLCLILFTPSSKSLPSIQSPLHYLVSTSLWCNQTCKEPFHHVSLAVLTVNAPCLYLLFKVCVMAHD